MKINWKKILCILIGHKDPVMLGLGIISQDELYENWKNWDRDCDRCGICLTRKENKDDF